LNSKKRRKIRFRKEQEEACQSTVEHVLDRIDPELVEDAQERFREHQERGGKIETIW
jgi:hypothetical protein